MDANFCPNCGCDMAKVAFALGLAERVRVPKPARNGHAPAPAAEAGQRRATDTPQRPPKKRVNGAPISPEERERVLAMRREGKLRAAIANALGIKPGRVDTILYGARPSRT